MHWLNCLSYIGRMQKLGAPFDLLMFKPKNGAPLTLSLLQGRTEYVLYQFTHML